MAGSTAKAVSLGHSDNPENSRNASTVCDRLSAPIHLGEGRHDEAENQAGGSASAGGRVLHFRIQGGSSTSVNVGQEDAADITVELE
jgi:hypothetical protein